MSPHSSTLALRRAVVMASPLLRSAAAARCATSKCATPVAAAAAWEAACRTMASGVRYEPKPWNYLWMPGPYPKTKEAREAAARKYGLIPEDYEPYPDDGEGIGDYPKLKPSSAESRSGLIDWDLPEVRRNFGEPLEFDWDANRETKFDDTSVRPLSLAKCWTFFLSVVGFFFLMYYLTSFYPMFQPVAEQQLPYKKPGEVKKFYTFELE